MDPGAFMRTVREHGVLPSWFVPVAWTVGIAEVLLGALIGLAYRSLHRALRLVSVLSLCFLSMFVFYSLHAPQAALDRVGCGCGPTLPGKRPGHDASFSRELHLFAIFGMALIHVPLIVRRVKRWSADRQHSASIGAHAATGTLSDRHAS